MFVGDFDEYAERLMECGQQWILEICSTGGLGREDRDKVLADWARHKTHIMAQWKLKLVFIQNPPYKFLAIGHGIRLNP